MTKGLNKPATVRAASTVNNGGTTFTFNMPLRSAGEPIPAWLVSVVVAIVEDESTVPSVLIGNYSTEGPIWVEVALLRSTGDFHLLDQGFIMNGPLASDHREVGAVGRESITADDRLIVHVRNDSTLTTSSTIAVTAEVMDISNVDDKNVLGGWRPINMFPKEATFIYSISLANNTTAGNLSMVFTVPQGSRARVNYGRFLRSGTGAAALSVNAFFQDASGAVLYDLTRTTIAGASFTNFPNIFGGPLGGQSFLKGGERLVVQYPSTEGNTLSNEHAMAAVIDFFGARPAVSVTAGATGVVSTVTSSVF